jgi:hypothetical protein
VNVADSNDGPLEIDAEALLDHRKRLDELRVNQITAYDKAILTLSTGAIGLSLLILQWIADRGAPTNMGAIGIAWALFLAAILANLFSYQTSFEDVSREIAKIDRDIEAGRQLSEDGNLFRHLTVFLNRFSLVCFASGTTLLFWFAYSNATGDSGNG